MEGRFSRESLIPWYDQAAIGGSRVAVVGMGALGNELAKDLVLAGVSGLTIVDMDQVESSNLTRCALFRELDVGEPKVKVASKALRELWGEVEVEALDVDVRRLDESFFSKCDAIFGCMDNIEARLHVNSHAYLAGVPYIDGGTDGMRGKVQTVLPPDGACLECTMNSSHCRELEERFSCTGLRREGGARVIASEITTTAIVAGLQAREGLKLLCGRGDLLVGGMQLYDGEAGSLSTVKTEVNPECPLHRVIKKVDK